LCDYAVHAYWSLTNGRHNCSCAAPAGGRWLHKADALLLLVPPGASQRAAVVKVFFDPRLYRSEYQGLLYGHLATRSTPNLRVPAILWTADTDWALVAEYVAGVSLGDVLRKQYFALSERYNAVFRDLGIWLGAFQALEVRSTDQRAVLDRHVQATFDNLACAAPRLGRRTERARKLLLRLAERLGASRPLLVRSHGDFIPDNVLISPDDAYIIDFALSNPNYVEQDVVVMCERVRWLLAPFPASRPAISRIEAAFMAGYTSETSCRSFSRLAVDLIKMRYVSHIVASRYHTRETSVRRRILQTYTYAWMAQHFERWVDQRARAYSAL
jgi:Ser/Thr protein kinase RdoA (MazF antagonist)